MPENATQQDEPKVWIRARVSPALRKQIKLAAAENDATVQAIITAAMEAYFREKP